MGDYCRTGGGIVRDYAEKHLNWAHLEVFSEILKRNLHVQKDLENGSGGRARLIYRGLKAPFKSEFRGNASLSAIIFEYRKQGVT